MRALVHLAHCSHGCAEPARARLLESRSDPGIPRGPCRPGHFFPYPGRAPGGRPYLGGAGGGGARRCGPGRRDRSVAEGWQGLRAVAGRGPAMSLVLLSLAALCCGAMPPEPVSPHPRPLPLSPPSSPDPNSSHPSAHASPGRSRRAVCRGRVCMLWSTGRRAA